MQGVDDRLEEIERAFWLGGAEHYRRRLTPGCLMVFPGAGALGRDEIIAGLESAPRWSRVAFGNWRRDNPAEGVAIVTYRAEAARDDDGPPYRADCGSVYVRAAGGWRLAFHQQTPVAPA